MTTLSLPAQLLHEQADACLRQWQEQLHGAAGAEPVCLDASALTVFDSSALALVLGLRRLVLAQGRTLQVTGMSERLRELATLYGVVALLTSA